MAKSSVKSMTAYGRAAVDHAVGRFTVEVSSVNRRYLECIIDLPTELQAFESDIKKWVSALVSRGQISVKISADFIDTSPLNAKPNIPLARQLKDAWDAIARELHLPEDSFKLEMIANVEGLISFETNLQDAETFRNILHSVVNMALKRLNDMKEMEGQALEAEIIERLDRITAAVQKIGLKAPNATHKFRKKLSDRLEELLAGSVENEERILREVGIYSEKIDIVEEVTRLESHLQQFRNLFNAPVDAVGKTFDFLLQEMLREINTVGSKSAELEVTQLVVEIKGELERIREQVQNIE
jgi:uncharacterized protein (TIGR00255 family)